MSLPQQFVVNMGTLVFGGFSLCISSGERSVVLCQLGLC